MKSRHSAWFGAARSGGSGEGVRITGIAGDGGASGEKFQAAGIAAGAKRTRRVDRLVPPFPAGPWPAIEDQHARERGIQPIYTECGVVAAMPEVELRNGRAICGAGSADRQPEAMFQESGRRGTVTLWNSQAESGGRPTRLLRQFAYQSCNSVNGGIRCGVGGNRRFSRITQNSGRGAKGGGDVGTGEIGGGIEGFHVAL